MDGERRLRVAKKLKLTEVPVIIEEPMTEMERLVKMFHLQEQHASWTTWEKANAIKDLTDQSGMTKAAIGAMLGLSANTVEEYNLINSITKRTATEITKRKLPFAWVVQIARTSHIVLEEDTRSDLENALLDKIDDKLIVDAWELRKYRIAVTKGGLPIVKKIISLKKYSPTQALEDAGAGNIIELQRLGSSASNVHSIGERLLAKKSVIVSRKTHATLVKAKKILDKLVDLDIEEEE